MTTMQPTRPFLRPFRQRLTSLMVAAALATAIIAAPAQAQISNENVAGWIAGAVALGIIAKAIDDQNRRDRASRQNRTPVHTPVSPGRSGARGLPAECLQSYSVRGETVRYFPAACLTHTYRDADRLPAACRQTIRTTAGNTAVYAPNCLRDRGFRLEQASGPGRGQGHGQWRHDRRDWR